MTPFRYAELAARLLRQRSRPDSPPSERDVETAVRMLEEHIASRRHRKRRAFGVLAAAAGIAIASAAGAWTVGKLARPSSSDGPSDARPRVAVVAGALSGDKDARVVHMGGSSSLNEGEVLDPGSRLLTSAGTMAELRVSTGTRLELREKTEIRVVEMGATERFFLGGGGVRADVAKLHAGERFIVGTPDAEIEVHGTSFFVELVPPDPSCPGGPLTRVTVYEGIVTVRPSGLPEVRVAPGEQWPASCVRASAAPPAPVPAPPGDSERRTGAARGNASRDTSSSKAPPRTSSSNVAPLAEQNALFAQAMAAKRRGDGEETVRILDRLVGAYPATPLLESALAERMKALRGRDGARARSAARQYLRSFPDGFAREEAAAILSEAP